MRGEHARALFHQHRERLEARFVSALDRADPEQAVRWHDADWHDEVLSARDRQTHHLLALTCVEFEPELFGLSLGPRHATAIFEFRNGHWCASGKHSMRCGRTKRSVAFGGSRRFSTPIGIRLASDKR